MRYRRIEIEDSGEDACKGSLVRALEFRHYEDSRELVTRAGLACVTERKNLFLFRGATTCAVISRDPTKCVVGTAWCYRKDKFNPRGGERVALRKAMEKAGMSREDRGKVWEGYLRERPVKGERGSQEVGIPHKSKVPPAHRIEDNPVLALYCILKSAGWTPDEPDFRAFVKAAVFCEGNYIHEYS